MMLDQATTPARPLKTLLLMRHAKSSWRDEMLDDIERPLNGRGRRAASAMAPLVAAWQPQWIGCSIAQRTRETLAPIVQELTTPCEMTLSANLYDSNEAAYLRQIRSIPGSVNRALIIGHNPTLEDLLQALVGAAEPDALARLSEKLPTGTLITLECPIARWSELTSGCAHLVDVIRPADISANA
ncbi:MAG: histidine phosphatase family protein [Devosiaceae bacterium]